MLKAGNDDCQARSDWFLPICSGAERLKDDEGRKTHPTQKPEALLARVLVAATNAGDLVLDPFFGSGTTGAVARRLRRSFIGIERDPAYAAAARRRIDAVEPLVEEAVATAPTRRSEPRVAFASVVEAGLVEPGEQVVDISAATPPWCAPTGRSRPGRRSARSTRSARWCRGSPPAMAGRSGTSSAPAGLTPIDDFRANMRAMMRAAAE